MLIPELLVGGACRTTRTDTRRGQGATGAPQYAVEESVSKILTYQAPFEYDATWLLDPPERHFMAKILTFRSKGNALPDEDFLKESDGALPFTAEGLIDIDRVRMSLTENDPAPISEDWDNQELANLFHVKKHLDAAGIVNATDRGLSNDGDPWFVFCRGDGDVIIHFCRINGLYMLDSPNLSKALYGHDFKGLITDFTRRISPDGKQRGVLADSHRMVRLEDGGTVSLHPSTALAILIWSLFLASDDLVLLIQDGQDEDGGTSPSLDSLIVFDK